MISWREILAVQRRLLVVEPAVFLMSRHLDKLIHHQLSACVYGHYGVCIDMNINIHDVYGCVWSGLALSR